VEHLARSRDPGRIGRGLAAALLALALLAGRSAAMAQGQPAQGAGTNGAERIAVLDVQALGGTPSEAAALTDHLRQALEKSGRFTLVDRGVTASTVSQRVLSPAGCTSAECVVKVGQLLGVSKVVAGRAVKLSDSSWFVSSVVVDVRSAKTLDAESVVHQGDFASLLQTGVPQLGEKMATASAVVAVGPAQAAGPAAAGAKGPDAFAAVGGGRVNRVAVYPLHITGAPRGSHAGLGRDLAGAIRREFQRRGTVYALTYAAYPAGYDFTPYIALRSSPLYKDLYDKTWVGSFNKTLDAGYLKTSAQQLKVDYVVAVSASPNASAWSYTLYLYNVAEGRLTQRFVSHVVDITQDLPPALMRLLAKAPVQTGSQPPAQ
jgi:Protein of unknown function (DUF2380)